MEMKWKIRLIYFTAGLVGILSYIETSSAITGVGKGILFIASMMALSATGFLGGGLQEWAKTKFISWLYR